MRISRLTSSILAGTTRKLVAVGTSRLVVMLETTRAALPRSGTVSPSWGRDGLTAGPCSAATAPLPTAPPSPGRLPSAPFPPGSATTVPAFAPCRPGEPAGPAPRGPSSPFGASSPVRTKTGRRTRFAPPGLYPSKNSRQLSLTEVGSSRNCSNISSTSQALGPSVSEFGFLASATVNRVRPRKGRQGAQVGPSTVR